MVKIQKCDDGSMFPNFFELQRVGGRCEPIPESENSLFPEQAGSKPQGK